MNQQILSHIRAALAEHPQLAGWLLYDYRGRNQLGLRLLDPSFSTPLTRRFFFWVPSKGEPVKIVHAVDEAHAGGLPGKTVLYSSWQELESELFSVVKWGQTIAMEYWTTELLPSQSLLDASTKEWLERKSIQVVSSWPLIGPLVGQLSSHQKTTYRETAAALESALKASWSWLTHELSHKREPTEIMLQERLIKEMVEQGLSFDSPPIVAAGPHTAEPHHIPQSHRIGPNMVVLIDAWGKFASPNAPYADFTQVFYTGKKVPDMLQKVYQVTHQAQEVTIKFVETCLEASCSITGAEVDDVCRTVINAYGFGKCFSHRTGHNIFTSVHGPGPNFDNFETRDTRVISPDTCYSIEPGIYIPKTYGIRLECNLLIEPNGRSSVFNRSPPAIPFL